MTSSSGGGGASFSGFGGGGMGPQHDIGGGGAGAMGREALQDSIRAREERERAAGPQRLTSEGALTHEAEVMRTAVTTTTPVFDEDDDTPCERGWVSFQASQESFAAQMGNHQKTAPIDPTSRASFLAQCRALPRAQQDCVDPAFRRANIVACEEFVEDQTHQGQRVARSARHHDPTAITIPPDPPARGTHAPHADD